PLRVACSLERVGELLAPEKWAVCVRGNLEGKRAKVILKSNRNVRGGQTERASVMEDTANVPIIIEHTGDAVVRQLSAEFYERIRALPGPLDKFKALARLQLHDAIVFKELLRAHDEEFLPILGSPTIGIACQQFSTLVRRTAGLW